MYPTLFELSLGGRTFAIDAHGLCMTLGVLAGLWLAVRLGQKLGLAAPRVRDLGLEAILVAVLGGRLLFVLLYAPAYASACKAALDSDAGVALGCSRPLWLWEGGLSFHGGLVAGLLWLAWRAPRQGMTALEIADVFAPGLALAHAVSRLGCFLAGCCFGRVSPSWGLRFPDESAAYLELLERGLIAPAADQTPPLHAVQLYDAAGHLVLAIALALLLRRLAARPGLILALYLAGHALLRLTLAPLHFDTTPRLPLGLSAQQGTALLLLLAAAVLGRTAARPRTAA